MVQAQAPVAEIDLHDLRVRSHPLAPAARAADGVAGPSRDALWLGDGMLAVTGSDLPSSPGDPDTPAGLTLIDTRTWRARTIDPLARTSTFAHSAGLLSAPREHGPKCGAPRRRETGAALA